MTRLLRFPLDHPVAVVLLTLAASAALGIAAARGLRLDNTIPAWLPPDDADLAGYEEFRRVFGEDDFVVVALDPVDLDAPEDRRAADALAADLAALDGVARVSGPFGASAEPRLASADRHAAAFLVHPRPGRLAGFFDRLEAEMARGPFAGRFRLAGPEAINHYLDVGSQESFGRLFPVAVVLIAIVVWLALRDARATLGVLAVSGLATGCTLGAMALAGRSLNMVVSTIPALLVILGTAYSLHLVTTFQDLPAGPARDRWAHAIRETFRPCFLTAATTAAGFVSLGTAELPPVQDLGSFAALGILVSFGLVFTFLPALLSLTGTAARPARAGEPTWFWSMERIRSARWPILAASTAAVALSVAGIARLRVESHILSFFPVDHPLVEATGRIEDDLLGLTPIEVWFHGPVERMTSPAMVAAARSIEATVGEEDAVTGIFGPLAAEKRLAGVSPERAAPFVRMALTGPEGARAPDRLRVEGDRIDVRWTIATRTLSVEESHALVDRVEGVVAGRLPEGVEASVTGSIPILVRIQALLLETQVRTFALSLVLVTGLLVFAFRSVRLALLSLVPNGLPILMTLGAMGFLEIPLDVATVTVASIALGLVVDDTIHLLDGFVRSAASGASPVVRLDRVFAATGRPIVFTALSVAIGFSAFTVAPFRPTFYFGLLIAGNAIAALFCDLLITPALILARSR